MLVQFYQRYYFGDNEILQSYFKEENMSEKIVRDLTKKMSLLCNAEEENEFISAAGSLLHYIDRNEFLTELFSPNFTSSLDLFTVISPVRGGWTQVSLPIDDEDKCSFILKFLREVVQNKYGLTSLLVSIYAQTYIKDNYVEFSAHVLSPCMDLLLDKVTDYLEEQFSPKVSSAGNTPLQITFTGNVNRSNIAVGNNNQQSVSSGFDATQFRKDFISALIQNDFDICDIAKISGDIEEFAEELEPSKQDPSKLKKLLLSMQSGFSEIARDTIKTVAIEQAKTFLTNPGAIVSLISSIL